MSCVERLLGPRRHRGALFAALVVAVFLGTSGIAGAGALEKWLAVEDPVEPCSVVAVLNGDPPARVDEAARLYHMGVGRQIWLTSDPRSGGSDAGDAGTAWNLARLLAHGGIPRAAIELVPGAASGTRAELEAIAAELRRRTLTCAVVVTSPLHARRVKATWQRVAGTSPRAVVRHAPDASYRGWIVELKELGGTVLAWTGLPR